MSNIVKNFVNIPIFSAVFSLFDYHLSYFKPRYLNDDMP
ncbi:hypothetical protein AOT82_1704 [Psychrobacter sp. AntiMn-1]|nr:hypothetical protein AOT82_1704 [Psychrobacter sp. AntiMn-1]